MNDNWNDYNDINANYINSQSSEQSDIVNPEVGTYGVVVENMRLKRNKNNQPAFVARMRHVSGKYQGMCTFFNQTLIARDQYDGFRVHSALEFLRSLRVCSSDSIQFVSLPDLEQKINTLQDMVNKGNLAYVLEVTKNKNGYDVYRLIDSYSQGQTNAAAAPAPAPAQAVQQQTMDLAQRTFAANQAFRQSLSDKTPQPQMQGMTQAQPQYQPQQYQQAQVPQWSQQQPQAQAPQQAPVPNYVNPGVDVPF